MKRNERLYAVLGAWLTVVLAAVLAGCVGRQVDARLALADELMEVDADSALSVLDEIDGASLSGGRGARYALLLTQAQDRNDIVDDDDSLISIAYSYYKIHGDVRQQMLASQYMGVVKMNGRNYGAALADALHAERLAVDIGDMLNAARTEGLIAKLYYDNYNLDMAIEYNKKSLEHSKAADRPDWVNQNYKILAKIYLMAKDTINANEYLDSARMAYGNSRSILSYEMILNTLKKNQVKVDSVYRIMQDSGYTVYAQDYACLGISRLGNDDIDEAREYLDSAYMVADSEQDRIDLSYLKMRIAIEEGDYQDAYYINRYLSDKTDSIFRQLSNNSLYQIQSAYDKSYAESIGHENEERRRKNWLLIGGMVLLVAVACGMIMFVRRRHQRNMILKKLILDDLRTEYELARERMKMAEFNLNASEQRNNMLAKQLRELKNDEVSRKIDSYKVFVEQFGWIERLTAMAVKGNSKGETNLIILKNMVDKELDNVRQSDFVEKMAESIDRSSSQLMSRVKTGCPSLTEQEFKILVYVCGGLSSKTIQILIDRSAQYLYNIKFKIRSKVKESAPDLAEELKDIF